MCSGRGGRRGEEGGGGCNGRDRVGELDNGKMCGGGGCMLVRLLFHRAL